MNNNLSKIMAQSNLDTKTLLLSGRERKIFVLEKNSITITELILKSILNHKYRITVLQQKLGKHINGTYSHQGHRFHFRPNQIRTKYHS